MSYTPPPPPPPPPSPGALVPVGLGTRFGAKLLDWLVLLVPNVILSVVVGGTATSFRSTFTLRGVVAAMLATALTFAYFTFLESSRGQTVGKMAVSIKVVGADGHPPSLEVAARRNAWLLLPLVPVVGDIAQFVLVIVIAVTISSGPFNRGWHDNFAGGTAVVRV
ncbi:RDD family protein [Actinospongicola halichondriae]|uniref:RDD family protein n=1 Tax=Actinospongicola halichondriae TaxID=3236844 RepID=UPI003D3C4BE5